MVCFPLVHEGDLQNKFYINHQFIAALRKKLFVFSLHSGSSI